MPIGVNQDNQLQWHRKKRSFYEVYYLEMTDPNGEWFFWVRYTLLVPQNPLNEATASLWGVFVKKGEPPVALKKTYPLVKIDLFHRDQFIQIDKSSLGLGDMIGILEEEGKSIEWGLHFEDPTVSSRIFPYGFLYKIPFPKTKLAEPRLTTFVTGHLRINGKQYTLEGAPAHQAHTWGTQYAKRWVWGVCHQFKEDPTAIFHGLVAQISFLGPLTSPPLTLFYFVFEGKVYKANKIPQWFTNKSRHSLFHWVFEVVCGKTKFVGELKRGQKDIVGLEYTGPREEKRYCHNTGLTDMKLTVYKKSEKKWFLYKELTAPQRAIFETVEPYPDPLVKFLL